MRALEEIGFSSWIAFSLCITGWDSSRLRRIGIGFAWIFTGSTVLLLSVFFNRFFHTFPWRLDELTSVSASGITMVLGRVAWYCLLLFLVSVVAAGIRAARKGRPQLLSWLFRVTYLVPIVIVLAMLSQIWTRSYAAFVWEGLPAVWLPTVASIAVLTCWKTMDQAGSRQVAFAAFMASVSIMGVAWWMWTRGPSLHAWAAHPLWKLTLRRVVPVTLLPAGLSAWLHA